METIIKLNNIALIIGGEDNVLTVNSPYGDIETVKRLRAIAFLLENRKKIEEIVPEIEKLRDAIHVARGALQTIATPYANEIAKHLGEVLEPSLAN